MSSEKPIIKISDKKQEPSYPTVKEIRRLCKKDSELRRNWPRDAILKWNEDHIQCEFCGLFLSNMSNYRRHTELHNKETIAVLRCIECNKAFSRSDHLLRHYRHYCHIIREKEATRAPPSQPQIQATNEVIAQATGSKRRRPFEWTLIPVDGTFETLRSKRKRNVRERRATIPLTSATPLNDPRIPTPITDDDALALERFLEENTNNPADNTNPQPTQNGSYEITEEDDRWLRNLVEPTPVNQNGTEESTLPVVPAQVTSSVSPIPRSSSTQTSPPRNLIIPRADDPWQRPPRVRSPIQHIPFFNESDRIDRRNAGPQPPWERPRVPVLTRKTIIYNNEEFLVIDELRE